MASLGLIKRKERWVLTGRGWITVLFGLAAILILTIATIHPFLAVNHPVPSEILVVEGWLPDYALKRAINEYKTHNYKLLAATGGSLPKGFHLSEHKTYAELAAATLKQLGFDQHLVVAVPTPFKRKDRTYESALALKKWLSNSDLSPKSINVISLGAHARRTWLLFEKALGNTINVGVIAVTDLDYDSANWWKSSEGVRTVIDEMIAYLYARFLFRSGSEAG